MILILSERNDSHVEAVAHALSERDASFAVFDPADYPSSCSASLTPGRGGSIAWQGRDVELAAVRSVWVRRPGRCKLHDGLHAEERDWLDLECRRFLEGLWHSLDAEWVSPLPSMRAADVKLRQLALAQELGLRVPRSLATNCAAAARAFIAECLGGAIVKVLGRPYLFYPGRAAATLYTHKITDDDLAEIDSVEDGPTFLQEFIPKRADVRVTVFGQRLFAVAMETGDIASARHDFRRADSLSLPHTPIELPDAVHNGCLELVDRLGLRFGAIDLLQTEDGSYLFLEINPNGQWLWLEQVTGLPLVEAMCDLLMAEDGAGGEGGRKADGGPGLSVPVGRQTLALPPAVAGRLAGSSDLPCSIPATQVWLEEKGGKMLLHVGDVQVRT